MLRELGKAVVTTDELVLVRKDDRRVATPVIETDQEEPTACMTRLPPPKLLDGDDEMESQTILQDPVIPLLPPLLPQSHTSPPDHMRDNAYVRTSRGFTTLTTSPLIHVQDADNRILEFELALIAGEKDAMPAIDATSFPNPSSEATV